MIKNNDVNIEALLSYIDKITWMCKDKITKKEHILTFIKVKLLECRLNILDKNLNDVPLSNNLSKVKDK